MMQYQLRWPANKNVLFVIPPLTDLYPNSVEDARDVDIIHPPLGILYLSAYVKKHGYDSIIVDNLAKKPMSHNEFQSIIESSKSNIVCISSMSANYGKALEYAEVAKSNSCIVIMGGPHPSCNYRVVVENPFVDIAIIGEGEIILHELINALNKYEPIDSIKGISYWNGFTSTFTGRSKRIDHLDDLPLPDYQGIDMNPYLDLQSLGLITSRGCPNNCAFCSSRSIWGKDTRFRTEKNVIEELDFFCNQYDYAGKNLVFYDDNLTLRQDCLFNICNAMIKGKYLFNWKCMSRVDTITIEMLQKMKSAGCYSISFGVETVNDESLKKIDKRITIKAVENAIKMCNEVGITFHGYFMIGFPWESKQDFMRTVDFIISHPTIEASLSVLAPYPGTDFYDNQAKWGIQIEERWDKFNHISSVIKSKSYTAEDIYSAFSTYLFYQERNKIK